MFFPCIFSLSARELGRVQVAPFELCTKLMDAAVAQGAKLVLGKVEGVTTVQEGASGSVPKVNGVIVDGASFLANPTFWTINVMRRHF